MGHPVMPGQVIDEDRRIAFITLSHEPGVGFAASGAARAAGNLGVAWVTYGAGALPRDMVDREVRLTEARRLTVPTDAGAVAEAADEIVGKLAAWGVATAAELRAALVEALEQEGPVLIEVSLARGNISATLATFTRHVGTSPPPTS